MRLRGPKGRVARALGVALSAKTARILEKRPEKPGQHGASGGRQKVSNYKRQLLEKQRLRAQYNVSERQLRNLFQEAGRLGGNAGERLLQLLESRLDAFTYRAGLAPTIFAARQMVSHGHVLVNGQRCSFPAREVKPGDKVSLGPKAAEIPAVVEARQRSRPPAYIDASTDKFEARYVELPQASQIPVICQISLVVEYYSR